MAGNPAIDSAHSIPSVEHSKACIRGSIVLHRPGAGDADQSLLFKTLIENRDAGRATGGVERLS